MKSSNQDDTLSATKKIIRARSDGGGGGSAGKGGGGGGSIFGFFYCLIGNRPFSTCPTSRPRTLRKCGKFAHASCALAPAKWPKRSKVVAAAMNAEDFHPSRIGTALVNSRKNRSVDAMTSGVCTCAEALRNRRPQM